MNIFSMVLALFIFWLAGCSQSSETPAGTSASVAKKTTRWLNKPKTPIGSTRGIVVEQTGEKVEATFLELKDGDGFVTKSVISHGKYFAAKKEIVFAVGPISPEDLDTYIQAGGIRVVMPFNPDADVLKCKWLGGPLIEDDYVRVKD